MFHKTLERQLRKYFGDEKTPPKEWEGFLQAISETYLHYDDDHTLIERALDISSKEHTEYVEALKKRTKEFESLADNTPDIIARFNKELRYVFVNQQIKKISGKSKEEFIGKTNEEIGIPNEFVVLLNHCLNKVFTTKEPQTLELQFPTPNGVVFLESKFVPELNDIGEVETALGITHDITERQQSQNLIASQKNFLDKMLDTISDPLFVKNDKHKWILFNQAFASLIGKPREELLNKSDHDFLPKEQADLFWKKDEEVLTTGTENINEEPITDGTGKVRTILTKKTRLIDSDNHKFIVGLILDITDRIRTENILKEDQEKLKIYEIAMNESPVSVVITDPAGTIQYVNRKFCTITGFSREEAIGQNPRILKSGVTPPEIYQSLWSTITAGNTWQGEFSNKKRNGDMYWEFATIAPLTTVEGKITNYIALKEDITERKEKEKIIQSRTLELERLNQTMIGRELKMIELKKEIEQLKQKLEV